MRRNALSGKVFIDDYLIEFVFLVKILLQIDLDFPFEELEEFRNRLCIHQRILLIIRVRKSIVLCPPFQASIPLFFIQQISELSLFLF